MESSASPSGASSHATQTGRPSLWSDSQQRKLGRLYVYTTLPLKKILDVIQASSPEAGPGKDSANKKLNAMLDKEPRWLRARTRTDMERRMNALATSPTRSPKLDFPSPLSQSHNISSFPPSPVEQKPCFSPSAGHDQSNGGIYSNPTAFPPPGPHDHLNPDVLTLHVPQSHHHHASFSRNHHDSHYADHMVAEPASHLPLETEPQYPSHTSTLRRFNPLLRRSTVMTADTDMTSTTLRRALSEYSSGFVTQVKRVMKRYTMPNHSPHNTSPIAENYPTAACSMRGSWIFDENAPPDMTCAPPLPGEFLVLDFLCEISPCPKGDLIEHQNRVCLCWAADEMSASCWMSPTGLSPRAEHLMKRGNPTPADFDQCDVFGNSLMHLLAARDEDHFHILELVSMGVNCRQRNSAGQTFLHLLNPSWLVDPTNGSGPLLTLLRTFKQDLSFFLARDCYGRTFFHALQTRLEDKHRTAFDQLLRAFDLTLFRDAFGSVPAAPAEMPIQPMRRAFTSVMDVDEDASTLPTESQSLPRFEDDIVSSQTRLLEFVSKCQADPTLEDAYGRNGLHCLAAAILSDTSLLRKAGGGADAQGQQPGQSTNKKRKRDTGAAATGTAKHSDSSKDRLTLRETIANNLLAAGVNPNHYDADGNTVLMAFAAQLPEDDDHKVPVSILQLLVNSGADVNARNRKGETALHVAVRRGRKLAMRTLVNSGANVHVRDGSGRGVLAVADGKIHGGAVGNKPYMHYEACRAWLSGQGMAVQEPSVENEWRVLPGRNGTGQVVVVPGNT